ncbi:hypothetical protein [Fodinicurvata sediminis]|uniref:hypothetical protein n=1 Tax=Fodinicurvata sediminis TaxID=1121832 RepID=UPI0003B6A9D0|nr:hypothetical protein [Fodinicurvata sediminis]
MSIRYAYRATMNTPVRPGLRGKLAHWLRRLAGRLDGGNCLVFVVQGDISPAGLNEVCRQLPRHLHRDLRAVVDLEACDRGNGIEEWSTWEEGR